MKNWNKVFKIILIVVVIFSLLYIFLMFKAKNLLTRKIEAATGHKTTIGKLEIKPPLNLEIRDVEITGLMKAGYIYLSPSIPSLLVGKIALNKIRIVNPELTYLRTPAPTNVDNSRAQAPDPVESVPAAAPAPIVENPFPILIKSLKIKSGKLNFIDSTAKTGSINITVKDIEFYITNLSSTSADLISNFILKGNISWNSREPDGKIFLRGWLNFQKKDIHANLKIEDIDAIVFYPYYSTWVDLEKARIEKAKLNFSSKIAGRNNNIDAQCHLELTDIVRRMRPPEEPQQKAERLTDAVLAMFKTMDKGRVELNFTLHTKMDQPEFSFGNIKSAFEGKLMQARSSSGLKPQDVLLWPGKLLQTGLKTGSDLTRAAVDGVFAIGNGVKKVFEDAMNKPAPGN